MAKRMPPRNLPGYASCCYQMTAAEWRHWVGAGESLGSGLTAIARGLAALRRRALSLSRAADNEGLSRRVSTAEAQAGGASR